MLELTLLTVVVGLLGLLLYQLYTLDLKVDELQKTSDVLLQTFVEVGKSLSLAAAPVALFNAEDLPLGEDEVISDRIGSYKGPIPWN